MLTFCAFAACRCPCSTAQSVRCLLSIGAKPNRLNRRNETPLLLAAKCVVAVQCSRDPPAVHGLPFTTYLKRLCTCLCLFTPACVRASRNGHLEVVQSLLPLYTKDDVNIRSVRGETALMLAVRAENIEVCGCLWVGMRVCAIALTRVCPAGTTRVVCRRRSSRH
jgi:ankyrin repeat protein